MNQIRGNKIMKKMIVVFAALIMSLGFAVSVMAAPSPDDKPWITTEATTGTSEDSSTHIKKDEFDIDDKDDGNGNGNGNGSSTTKTTKTTTSASPKTGDQGAPVSLVYASLAAAALAVYAAKRVKEQY